ncbi:MAG: amidohydrolase family protein [bacterium]|nr:amidohydrolase family protein [bacterium]
MIIDSHVYCFEPGDDAAGFASREEHLRWVQEAQGLHHQPAWRVRDRAPASSEGLIPESYAHWAEMPDVNFRIDHAKGRVVWTIDGEDYTKQFYPPNLRNLEFTPESLISEMDYAGVDMAVIHTNPMLTRDVGFLAECVRLYPDRLRCMAPVDEWRILSEMDVVIEEMNAAVVESGLHAIKFNARPAYFFTNEPWDSERYRPFWDAATALNVPIFFTLGSGPRDVTRRMTSDAGREGYLKEQKVLMRWMERYPDAVVNLTHGFPWRAFVAGEGFMAMPEEIWEPFQSPNCHLEVCFPVRIGDWFDFPYPEVWPVLEEMVERVGANRLNWGTDMPFQNRFCTYRQSRRWIEKYCTFLSEEDLQLIMGGTTAKMMGMDFVE